MRQWLLERASKLRQMYAVLIHSTALLQDTYILWFELHVKWRAISQTAFNKEPPPPAIIDPIAILNRYIVIWGQSLLLLRTQIREHSQNGGCVKCTRQNPQQPVKISDEHNLQFIRTNSHTFRLFKLSLRQITTCNILQELATNGNSVTSRHKMSITDQFYG